MTRLVFPEQRLGDLLPDLPLPAGQAAMRFSAVTDDSRQVDGQTLFIARKGVHHAAEEFVMDARHRGAGAILTETAGSGEDRIVVANLGRIVAALVSRALSFDLDRFRIVGVTGTNGKTSVANFIASALSLAGAAPVGIIGTLGAGLWTPELDRLRPVANTTPGQLELLGLLSDFSAAGVRYVTIEVSSHAMAQGRLDGIPVQVAVFTNLTRDHLDYHGDMAGYFNAKAKLFERDELVAAVVNFDSQHALELLERVRANPASNPECWAYGLGDPDWVVDECQLVQARSVVATVQGLELRIDTPAGAFELCVNLAGLFNASNLMAALSALLALGMPQKNIREALAQLKPPPGRMQKIESDDGPRVVVDYAHTPDALDQALRALRDHLEPEGRLICVFGCGGDRDRGKRPLMGSVAERLADVVVLTDDNPRHERPEHIVADILSGIEGRDAILVEHDRARAIAHAIGIAKRQDWVLIAGKGHEAWQEIGDRRIAFSDAEVATQCLREGRS